jgi:transposase
VFVDECGSNLGLTPLYARAPKGQLAVGVTPRNWGANTTTVTALTPGGMGPALLLEGAVTKAAFEVYVEHQLAPTLRAGQIVVLDNLGAHQGQRTRAAIEARGAELWFLPAYSPDLTPIEEAFAKLKRCSDARRPARRRRSRWPSAPACAPSPPPMPAAGSATPAIASRLNSCHHRCRFLPSR